MSTITDDRTETQTISGAGNVLKLTRKGSVVVDEQYGSGIHQIQGASNNKLIVDGLVRADAYGIYSEGEDLKLIVGKTGQIQGDAGVFVQYHTATIINSGDILGTTENGIGANQFLKLQNSGSIIGDDNGVNAFRGADISNHGSISGSQYGVRGYNGLACEIDNYGTIRGLGSAAIETSSGEDRVTNAGRIVGDVKTGAGEDTVLIRKGSIQGDIITGADNDTLITNSNKFKLTELADGGSDSVKSSVSYTLSANVEFLTLLGKTNINATGTDGTTTNNYIYGNVGKNVLNGLGGYNELFGRGGTDMLIGGANYDLFGIGKHCGRDTVKGFQDSLDEIDVYKLGMDNFEDLQKHIKDHGNDTWIDFGKDVLILKNVDHTVLDENDFLFNY